MSEKSKKELISFLKSFGDIGFYAKDFSGKKEIKHNENELFFTISCYKIITAIALYQKLESDNLKDTDTLDYKQKDRVGGSSILQIMRPHKNSIFNFLVLMLKLSDNTAMNIIENFVSMKAQRDTIKQLKLKDTKIRLNIKGICYGNEQRARTWSPKDDENHMIETNAKVDKNQDVYNLSKSNVSTPLELCRVLEELTNPTLISKENANKIIEILKHYDAGDRIIELGKFVEIATKAGWKSGVRSDMNIVFSKNPFYLVVMAKGLSGTQRNKLVSSYNKIMKLAIDYFDN